MRIFALSDLHIDNRVNLLWTELLSPEDYVNDTLIVAGDISDDLEQLKKVLSSLRNKFKELFFIPGNHELWVRKNGFDNSIEKFYSILKLCNSLDIKISSQKAGEGSENPVWIVPLHAWYVKPEEGDDSLFLPKEGEDASLSMWRDNEWIKWPDFNYYPTAADFFLEKNRISIQRKYDAPVITYSHFLPRRELMFPDKWNPALMKKYDRYPAFNFSRVAGTVCLDEQIRQISSAIHIYGHQHRNRDRIIDGVRYVSFCLGYPNERKHQLIRDVEKGPKLIWDTEEKETRDCE